MVTNKKRTCHFSFFVPVGDVTESFVTTAAYGPIVPSPNDGREGSNVGLM
jgi:hypothetical protein